MKAASALIHDSWSAWRRLRSESRGPGGDQERESWSAEGRCILSHVWLRNVEEENLWSCRSWRAAMRSMTYWYWMAVGVNANSLDRARWVVAMGMSSSRLAASNRKES